LNSRPNFPAQNGQAGVGKAVIEADDSIHDGLVDVGWQCPLQRLVELGRVSGKHRQARRPGVAATGSGR
jgi:hypothetical protein